MAKMLGDQQVEDEPQVLKASTIEVDEGALMAERALMEEMADVVRGGDINEDTNGESIMADEIRGDEPKQRENEVEEDDEVNRDEHGYGAHISNYLNKLLFN